MDFGNGSSSSPNPSSSSDSSSQAPRITSHKRKAGRKKFQETRHPLYRGVRRKNGNRWVCEIREPNKPSRIWLGTYPTPEMAARAHDVAALALRGSSALLNFPNSALLLPASSSSSVEDIRAAATKAAKAFRPIITSSSSHDLETKCENITNPCSVEGSSSSSSSKDVLVRSLEENYNDDECRTLFLDEEALYNMPGLLDSMAEGLLLSPPSMKISASDWDDINTCEIDLTLWTH